MVRCAGLVRPAEARGKGKRSSTPFPYCPILSPPVGFDPWRHPTAGAALVALTVLCGEKTVDGDTGQIGPAVAERLGIAMLPFVSQITDVTTDKVTAVTETSVGSLNVEASFPLLVTGTKELNIPRLPTLKEKLRARKAEVEKWTAADLGGADVSKLGAAGSGTVVESITVPPEKKRKGEVLKGEDAASQLVAALDKAGLLKG